ncbi:uncharacterized protein NESG_00795 [Nematocida ausubeli]|uniref:Uncharacterized protein n=1 Tax=Nematocida ausubeli (strain ATCC PRA-371 / ERTm2) TaxID=1913371 RepID=A0A086J3C6_NEMA1|nr:uncharacterized protein NESG_00795 [Nematocida ausubeli]KFG26644.1 hypothetical protein NESG_00795 [Nematocida ausubeli]
MAIILMATYAAANPATATSRGTTMGGGGSSSSSSSSSSEESGFISLIFFAPVDESEEHGKAYRFFTSPFVTVGFFVLSLILVAGGVFGVMGAGGSSGGSSSSSA